MKHEGYNLTAGNPAYKYQYNGKELQIETGNYAMDWRSYMPDLGRFSGMDMLSESYLDLTPYHFGANNPIMFSDPTGMYIKDSNGSFSTTNLDEITELKKYFAIGGSVDNMDKLVADNPVFKVDIPGATISVKGNEHTWNLGNNFLTNSYRLYNAISKGFNNATAQFDFKWDRIVNAGVIFPFLVTLKSRVFC